MSRRLYRFVSTTANITQNHHWTKKSGGFISATSSAGNSTTATTTSNSTGSGGLFAGISALLLGSATASSMAFSTTTSAEQADESSAASPTRTISESTKKKKNDKQQQQQQQQQQYERCHCHTLFVWDFDWTIVNCNSDEYIPAQFLGQEATIQGFRDLYTNGANTKGNWHACVEQLVNHAMRQFEKDTSSSTAATNRIMDAARQMPYLIPIKETLQAINAQKSRRNNNQHLGAVGTGQMILSDGNTLFIQTFLQHVIPNVEFNYGIISNHGSWKNKKSQNHHHHDAAEQDEDNVALCVIHQSQQYGGHNCQHGCPTNLCKTQALQETLKDYYYNSSSTTATEETATFPNNNGMNIGRPARIVYIGDGANDACPALNVLRHGDVLLARVGQKHLYANKRKGPESDQETANSSIATNGSRNKNHDNKDNRDVNKDDDSEIAPGATFGIIPALDKAKKENPSSSTIPACQVYEWTTGEELQQLVLKLLQDLPASPPPQEHKEKE